MNKLKNRKIINKISKFLKDDEIIVLHGARQVGKTSILRYLITKTLKNKVPENNLIYLDLEDPNLLELCNSGVAKVIDYLKGINCNFNQKIYLFIDEIQYLDNPSSFLKLFYDQHQGKVKLIVTGSSSFAVKSKFKDSLVGRTVNFEIFTLDFEEFLDFKEKNINLQTKLPNMLQEQLKDLYQEFALIGGYPAIVLEQSLEKKEVKLKQIINTYIKKDIRELADIRNPDKFNDLIKLLASQTGGLLNTFELSNTLNLAVSTVEDYLFILENTYIIRRVRPFHKNIRSELTKMPKIFLEDTGIANILANKVFLRVLTGNLFENSVYANLRRHLETDNIYFWRTNNGQEIDFVVDSKKLMLMEVKLNYSDKEMKNLIYFSKHYKNKNLFCVALNKKPSKYKDIKQIYPWELFPWISG